MRLSTIVKLVAVLMVLVVVEVIAAGKSLKSDAYNTFLAERVKAATGLDMTFGGVTKLKLGLAPVLSFTGVTLSAGRGAVVLYVDRIEARVPVLPLALRQLRLDTVTLFRPVLHPEQLAAIHPGRSLDLTGGPSGAPDTRPGLLDVRVEDGAILLAKDKTVKVDKAVLRPDGDAGGSLAVQMTGTWQGLPLDLTGSLGSLAHLAGPKPYPIQFKIGLANSNLSLRGTLSAPLAGTGLDLELRGQGEEFSNLLKLAMDNPPAIQLGPYKIAAKLTDAAGALAFNDVDAIIGRKDTLLLTAKGHIADVVNRSGVELLLGLEADSVDTASQLVDPDLPNAGPLKLSAHLGDIENGWRLTGIKSTLGTSDLAGELSLIQGPHPRVYGRLSAGLLNLGDFSLPQGKGSARALASQPQRPAIPIADGRIIGLEQLPLDGLRQMDADLSVSASRLQWHQTTLGEASAGIRATGGKVAVTNFAARSGSGKLTGELTLDVSPRTPVLSLQLKGNGLDSAPLTGGAVLGAKADLAFDLRAQGGSPRAMAGTATGSFAFSTGPGNLAPQAGGEFVSTLTDQIDAEAVSGSGTAFKCLVAHLPIKGGLISTDRGIAVETARAAAISLGSIDLRTEDVSLTVARRGASPLRISGTLGAPVVESDGLGKVQSDATPCRTAQARRLGR